MSAALLLMQDVVQLMQQQAQAKDLELKKTATEMTEKFEAEGKEAIKRYEAEHTETIRRYEAKLAAIKRFGLEALDKARSTAQVRLTMVLVLASAGSHLCLADQAESSPSSCATFLQLQMVAPTP